MRAKKLLNSFTTLKMNSLWLTWSKRNPIFSTHELLGIPSAMFASPNESLCVNKKTIVSQCASINCLIQMLPHQNHVLAIVHHFVIIGTRQSCFVLVVRVDHWMPVAEPIQYAVLVLQEIRYNLYVGHHNLFMFHNGQYGIAESCRKHKHWHVQFVGQFEHFMGAVTQRVTVFRGEFVDFAGIQWETSAKVGCLALVFFSFEIAQENR